MESIRQDRVNLCCLKSGCLLEGQVSWPSQVVVKHIVVQLQLPIHLEEFDLPVLQKALLKLLDVDIGELAVNLRVVHIDSIKAQIFKHVLVLVEVLVSWYV